MNNRFFPLILVDKMLVFSHEIQHKRERKKPNYHSDLSYTPTIKE